MLSQGGSNNEAELWQVRALVVFPSIRGRCFGLCLNNMGNMGSRQGHSERSQIAGITEVHDTAVSRLRGVCHSLRLRDWVVVHSGEHLSGLGPPCSRIRVHIGRNYKYRGFCLMEPEEKKRLGQHA